MTESVEEKAPLLQIKHVSKRFDTTQALDDVSLDLYPGEIHALMGENGAGKSTLIKIMTGVYHADNGEMLLDGEPIQVSNSVDAQAYGIAAIYQEPMIYPDLNVAENVFISHRSQGIFVNWRKMYRDAEEILAKLDVKLDVRMPALGLTLAAQQAIEIAKAISLHVRVLIMAPTTVGIAAAAKAMQDEGLCDEVKVSGLGLPSEMASFVKNGCAPEFALWSFYDLGYLTYYLAYRIASGEIDGVEGETFDAGVLYGRKARAFSAYTGEADV